MFRHWNLWNKAYDLYYYNFYLHWQMAIIMALNFKNTIRLFCWQLILLVCHQPVINTIAISSWLTQLHNPLFYGIESFLHMFFQKAFECDCNASKLYFPLIIFMAWNGMSKMDYFDDWVIFDLSKGYTWRLYTLLEVSKFQCFAQSQVVT